MVKIIKIGLFLLVSTIVSCNNDSHDILEHILPSFESYDYDVEIFKSRDWVQPHLIVYKARMPFDHFNNDVFNNCDRVPGCFEFRGRYETMVPIAYPFDITDISWWQPMNRLDNDFVGHFDYDLKKFTGCIESRQYRYAFKYLNGYCYLIIENTLSKKLD